MKVNEIISSQFIVPLKQRQFFFCCTYGMLFFCNVITMKMPVHRLQYQPGNCKSIITDTQSVHVTCHQCLGNLRNSFA